MAKEIKKGSREAKKLFEGYKKRLEAGEQLYLCWFKDYSEIFTQEQKNILFKLENEIIDKETAKLKAENAVLEKIIANPCKVPTQEEVDAEMYQKLLERIKDLPKEEQDKEIAFHHKYIEFRNESLALQLALDKEREQEEEMLSEMTSAEVHEYFMNKFERSKELINYAPFKEVKILEPTKKFKKSKGKK